MTHDITEEEWLKCQSPYLRVFSLHSLGRERNLKRKFLLFTCACFRRGRKLDRDALQAVETLERHADGKESFETIVALRAKLGQPDGPAWPLFTDGIGVNDSTWSDPFWQYHASWQTAGAIAHAATSRKPGRPSKAAIAERARTEAELMALVQCILGNPFCPAAIDPAWLTSTVVALARGIYEDRAFDRMPILGDALEDAACDNADMLSHCRDANATHVRGCWVVDLVLGKE